MVMYATPLMPAQGNWGAPAQAPSNGYAVAPQPMPAQGGVMPQPVPGKYAQPMPKPGYSGGLQPGIVAPGILQPSMPGAVRPMPMQKPMQPQPMPQMGIGATVGAKPFGPNQPMPPQMGGAMKPPVQGPMPVRPAPVARPMQPMSRLSAPKGVINSGLGRR